MTTPSGASPVENRLTKPPRWRRALRALGWLLAAIVVLLVIWVGAQLSLRRPRPAPMFTNADLPALPSPDENGWEVLKNEIRTIGDPKRPDNEVTEICDAKATFDDRWARAEARAQKLSDIAHDDSTILWMTLVDKASSRPRFVDACPIEFEPNCPRMLQLLALHQIQEAVVLHDVMGHRWDDAFTRTARMMRTAVDFLPSSRSTLSQAVARAQVHRSIKLVEVLLDGVTREKQQGRGPEAARLATFARDVDSVLTKIREEDMAPMRAVIAEYLFSAYALEHLTDSPNGRFSEGGGILYDSGHAMEMLNEQFEKYVAFARADGVGDVPVFSRSSTWFLRNPVGHIALEVTRGMLENHVPSIIKDRSDIMKDRGALHLRLTALANAQ